MNAAVHARDVLMPRRADGIGRGLMLALVVHVGLVIAIAFGVHWRSREPESMSAELWSAVPQAAAPRAAEPEVRPAPKPEPPPPKPAPKVEETPRPTLPDPQIAIEKEKRELLRKQREEEERERDALRRKQAAEKQAAEKEAAEKQAAKERQQQALEAERRKQDEERREAQRQANLKRIMGQAGASGEPGSAGTATQSSGPSASYAGRIRAKIKPNIVFPDEVSGNPVATVEVRLAPDGSIVGTPRLLKSSGVPGWDEAVMRAVVKTEVLPRDVDGRVPPTIEISFRPRD